MFNTEALACILAAIFENFCDASMTSFRGGLAPAWTKSLLNQPLSSPITILCNDIQLAMKKLHYKRSPERITCASENLIYMIHCQKSKTPQMLQQNTSDRQNARCVTDLESTAEP